MALIAMKRSEPMRPGGPVDANVDESQVAEWRKRGWVVYLPPVDNASTKVYAVGGTSIDMMTVPELRAIAKEQGVNIPAALKDRAKIIAAIKSTIGEANGPLD